MAEVFVLGGGTPTPAEFRLGRDHALPIGHDQTISQPFVVAVMTEKLLANSAQHQNVLEIGTGSGYQAAVLAELSDHVFSIEIIPELAEQARSVLEEQ